MASNFLPTAGLLPAPVRALAGRISRSVQRAYPLLGAFAGGFATVAVLVAVQQAGAPLWAVNAAMLTPGAVCAVLIPSSRRRAYRWLVLLLLAQVVHPWVTAPFLLFGTTWALWRTWIERPAPAPVRPAARPAKVSARKGGKAAAR